VSGVTVAAVSERSDRRRAHSIIALPPGMFCLGRFGFKPFSNSRQALAMSLGAADGLGAALHTPAWVRKHPDQATYLQEILSIIKSQADGPGPDASAPKQGCGAQPPTRQRRRRIANACLEFEKRLEAKATPSKTSREAKR